VAVAAAEHRLVKNNWNDLAIGVCAGPSGSWKTLWPHMKHYD
jgi:hypothetical protein